MTAQIRNIELSFEDIAAALAQFTSEERQRLFEKVEKLKNGSNGQLSANKNFVIETNEKIPELESTDLALTTEISAITPRPLPFVMKLQKNVPIQEQIIAMRSERKKLTQSEYSDLLGACAWTDDDPTAEELVADL